MCIKFRDACRRGLVAGPWGWLAGFPFCWPLVLRWHDSRLCCLVLQLCTRVEHRHKLGLRAALEVSGALSSGGCPFFFDPGSRCCVCGWGKVDVGLPTFLHIFSSMIQILIMNWVFNSFLKSKSFGFNY